MPRNTKRQSTASKAMGIMPTSEWRQEFLSGISIASMVHNVFILRACSHNNGSIRRPSLLTTKAQTDRCSRSWKMLTKVITFCNSSRSNTNGFEPKLASTFSPGVLSPTVGYNTKPTQHLKQISTVYLGYMYKLKEGFRIKLTTIVTWMTLVGIRVTSPCGR